MSGIVRFEAVGRAVDVGLLTDAERARRDNLRRKEDRRAYEAAHVLVRECAGELLGLAPDKLKLTQTCPICGPGHGRPSIVGHPEVGVSLSHSSQHVAAVASWGSCGIDVETLADLQVEDSVLTQGEQLWLSSQEPRAEAFARLWVRKEALVKLGMIELGEADTKDLLRHDAPTPDYDGIAFGERVDADFVGVWAMAGR